MNERTRKRIVYAVFVGAVIFGLVARPWERPGRHIDSAAAGPVAAPAETVATTGIDRVSADTAVVIAGAAFASSWPRDPFRGRGTVTATSMSEVADIPEPVEPALVLQGVMTVDGQRVCVISGRIGKVGSVIDGWRVLRIDESRVHLVRGQETLRLDLS